MLTAERLRELLNYDHETGIFTRRVRTSTRIHVGEKAGTLNACGYWQIRIDSQVLYAHRLAWLFMTGKWPTNEIDHLNGKRADNRFANLRDVPRRINLQNQRSASKNSRTGTLGVIFDRNRYVATITLDRQQRVLGRFLTESEAHAAYLKAKRAIHEGSTL